MIEIQPLSFGIRWNNITKKYELHKTIFTPTEHLIDVFDTEADADFAKQSLEKDAEKNFAKYYQAVEKNTND